MDFKWINDRKMAVDILNGKWIRNYWMNSIILNELKLFNWIFYEFQLEMIKMSWQWQLMDLTGNELEMIEWIRLFWMNSS